jgi:hypothetical protein
MTTRYAPAAPSLIHQLPLHATAATVGIRVLCSKALSGLAYSRSSRISDISTRGDRIRSLTTCVALVFGGARAYCGHWGIGQAPPNTLPTGKGC